MRRPKRKPMDGSVRGAIRGPARGSMRGPLDESMHGPTPGAECPSSAPGPGGNGGLTGGGGEQPRTPPGAGHAVRFAAAALYELFMLLPLFLFVDHYLVPDRLERVWLFLAAPLSAAGAVAGLRLGPMWQRLALALAAGGVCHCAAGGGWRDAAVFALAAGAVLQGATAVARAQHQARYFSGVGIYTVASIVSAAVPELRPLQGVLTVSGAAVLAVAVFALNRAHLAWAAQAEDRQDRVPRAVRRHNRFYLAGLLAVVLALAGGLGSLLWDAAVYALREVLEAILRLPKPEVSDIPPDAAPSAVPEWTPDAPKEPSAWSRILDLMFLALGYALAAAGLAALAVLVWRRSGGWLRSLVGALLSFLQKKSPRPSQDLGYVDEETSLFSWEEAVRRLRENRMFRRLERRREERWEDMPDNRARVRFLYRRWLRRLEREGCRPPRHLTPRETLEEASAFPAASAAGDVSLLIELYYRARYAEAEPTDEEMAALMRRLERDF